MSQADVERLRGLYEAFNSGDRDTLFARLAEDMVWRGAQDLEPHHGHAGVRTSLGNWTESLDDASFEPLSLIDAGDSVIGEIRSRGRGRGSGVEIEETF